MKKVFLFSLFLLVGTSSRLVGMDWYKRYKYEKGISSLYKKIDELKRIRSKINLMNKDFIDNKNRNKLEKKRNAIPNDFTKTQQQYFGKVYCVMRDTNNESKGCDDYTNFEGRCVERNFCSCCVYRIELLLKEAYNLRYPKCKEGRGEA